MLPGITKIAIRIAMSVPVALKTRMKTELSDGLGHLDERQNELSDTMKQLRSF